MTILSSIWKGVKLLKKMDYFGVNLNFKFNKDEKYKSLFGGIVFLIYFVFSLTYSLLIFDSFIKRKSMNLVFNEGYKDSAPEINFSNYSVEFAVGLTTGDASKFSLLYKYLDISFTSTNTSKINGTIFKYKKVIPLLPCQPEMFFNLVNSSYDALGISNYFCPNISNVNVRGLFTEDIFAYFDFATSVKKEYYNKTEEVKKLLIDYEIKANFFYLDTSVTVNNYHNPIQNYLNNKFITLDFGFYKKLNVDFMVTTWISDANILFQESESFDYVVLDNFQEYFSDLGQNRFEKKTRDFMTLSKIYIRSGTRTRLIKRVYTKFTEYLAQMSSILSSSLLILYGVVTYINLFKAQQSIMKKVLKYKDNINEKKHSSILYLKDKFMNIERVNQDQGQDVSFNVENNKSTIKNRPSLNNTPSLMVENMDNSSDLLNLNVLPKINEDSKSKIQSNHSNHAKSKNSKFKPSAMTWMPRDKNIESKFHDEESVKNNLTVITNPSAINLRRHKFSTNTKVPVYRKYSKNKLDPEILKMTRISNENLQQVSMSYNVCQIIAKTICCCCRTTKTKIKEKLYDRGYIKIINDMDVLTYIRKMHEIDILKYLLLNKKQISLFNFISKPSVSLQSKNQIIDAFQEKFEVKFNKDDIDILDKNFHEMISRENPSRFDKKLFKLVASEIDNLIIDV